MMSALPPLPMPGRVFSAVKTHCVPVPGGGDCRIIPPSPVTKTPLPGSSETPSAVKSSLSGVMPPLIILFTPIRTVAGNCVTRETSDSVRLTPPLPWPSSVMTTMV